jgi:hypothetical protein
MIRLLACSAVGLLFLAGWAVAQDPKKPPSIMDEMKKREKEIAASEARKEWKKISWRATPIEAVADGTKENKPLLIVLIVGELGKPNAERC